MPIFRTGTDDFKELIDDGGYFVDKSLLIAAVAAGNKVTLLPRPRRFGKTLNMTMLRYFFEKSNEDRSRLFHGLAVTQHPEVMAHQGLHPVIYFSLKDIKGENWAEAQEQIVRKLSAVHREHRHLYADLDAAEQMDFDAISNLTASAAVMKLSLKTLISHLYRHHGQPVVILIDEYDSPIIEAWRKDYYQPMIEFMRSWLGGGLKHENGTAIYRAVVTGILRVAKESIFSGLNNLDVQSVLSPGAFANKFGFTQMEVNAILPAFGLPQLAQPIREWYNGYSFGGTTIYNPWSVICAVQQFPAPIGPQWLNTASNELIYAELESGDLDLKRDLEVLLAGGELRHAITEHMSFGDVRRTPGLIWSFLLFSGYLRAEDPQPHPLRRTETTYRLSIPNLEVALVYERFIAHWQQQLDFRANDEMLQALLVADWPVVARLLTELVRNLVSVYDVSRYPEAVYHALVLGLLANLRHIYTIRSNPESGYGRADIIMQPKTYRG